MPSRASTLVAVASTRSCIASLSSRMTGGGATNALSSDSGRPAVLPGV